MTEEHVDTLKKLLGGSDLSSVKQGIALWGSLTPIFEHTTELLKHFTEEPVHSILTQENATAVFKGYDQQSYLGLWLLTELARFPEMNQLTKAKLELVIVKSNITELPENITALSNIQKIELDEDAWRYLEQDLYQLSSLESIEMFGSWSFFGHSEPVYISEDIQKLQNLKNLTFCETKLVKLPDSIGSLPKLESLRVNNTPIESLPKTLGNLKTLRYLCILGTGFEELPDVIKALDGLQELDIEQVPLKNNRVPDWVMQLPSLTYLQMNETTEEELERLKKLGPNVDILAEGLAPI